MDKINKTINIDNIKSHRKGLIPFVRYGGNTIETVNGVDTNGNYGQYVCDFCVFSGDGETVIEVARMKYLDVIRRYNFVHRNIKRGVCVKKVKVNETIITKINCGDKIGSLSTVESEVKNTIKFTTNFNTYGEIENENIDKNSPIKSQDEDLLTYDYIPLDANLFSKSGGLYTFDAENRYEYIKNIVDSEIDEIDDFKSELEKFERHIELINSNEFFILISNYDDVIKMNDLWENWWVKNFKSDGNWREIIFDGYDGKNYALPFYVDVNKYIIGEIEIPSKFNGELVPSYISYLDYFEYKKWFETNSASTYEAYLNTIDENEWIIDAWESRGGGDFYNFLVDNPPLWQSLKTDAIGDNGVYFKYSAPIMELNAIINNETDFETLYNVYEYSAQNNEFVGAVTTFSPTPISAITYVNYAFNSESGELERVNKYYFKDSLGAITIDEVEYAEITPLSISANGLTKQWVEFNEESGYANCESQLPTLIYPLATMVTDKIYGTYKVYDESAPENGQMFKCTFCSGTSVSADIKTYLTTVTTVYDSDGKEIEKYESYDSNSPFIGGEVEIPPYTSGEDVYQVIGVKIIGSSAGTEEERNIISNEENTVVEEVYRHEKVWYDYSWWECVKVSNKEEVDSKICADGEDVTADSTEGKYRNVVILSCIENIVGTCNYGDYYYFLSKYDNGNTEMGKRVITEQAVIKTIEPPYKPEVILKLDDDGNIIEDRTDLDVRLNVNTYSDGTIVYDKIFSIDYTNENFAIIKYAKGITHGDDEKTSGIHYEETLSYELNKKTKIPIDGVYVAEVYYDELGINDNGIDVSSEEFKLSRITKIAKITGMEVGTQWTENSAVNAMLITKDGSEGLQEEPKYNINLLFNRGNAAANENHFKLSECNTLEDLEKYGNNFFNL